MKFIKKAMIIIAALAIGIAIALYVNRTDTNSSSDTSNANQSNQSTAPALGEVENVDNSVAGDANVTQASTVQITDDGFSPEIIRVEPGTTVTFENVSSRNAWVASDSHPSHTDLPEFDAGRGYAPGEPYSYTFSQSGEWGYHDHLRSFVTGLVIVEE